MDVAQLPALNAALNATAAVFLLCGWIAIKRGAPHVHRKLMIAAFTVSILFLTSYLYYHYNAPGMTKYSGTGILRLIYFAILISHIVLAAVITPSGDPVTLMMLGVPMLILYFVAILVGWLIVRKRPTEI